MPVISLLLWLANFLILFGMWRLGRKHRDGFVYSFLGSLVWGANGVYTHNIPLVFINAALMGIYIRDWFIWSKK